MYLNKEKTVSKQKKTPLYSLAEVTVLTDRTTACEVLEVVAIIGGKCKFDEWEGICSGQLF